MQLAKFQRHWQMRTSLPGVALTWCCKWRRLQQAVVAAEARQWQQRLRASSSKCAAVGRFTWQRQPAAAPKAGSLPSWHSQVLHEVLLRGFLGVLASSRYSLPFLTSNWRTQPAS